MKLRCPCGDGRSEYSCHHHSSHGCCTRRLREYNGERAASSVQLLPSTLITIPSEENGDYGKTQLLEDCFSPADDCYYAIYG
ncbi:jg3783 [Pararge aegeria aegeria]|uniref:Jg3783 protein n=1 Tax=Pararge aegeria aegeria TaxID=348720 RepID=A0A8S4SHY5_9NEOP|nr:jg3783 [Pararge aegeria aegeria]